MVRTDIALAMLLCVVVTPLHCARGDAQAQPSQPAGEIRERSDARDISPDEERATHCSCVYRWLIFVSWDIEKSIRPLFFFFPSLSRYNC